ncbi:MAG: transcriptional repressor LexA [Gammaproteobacteria bacterium]|nr:transcriptional repressor LexA [Gammaproteobacteria bacterium]MCF6230173.1 transcriptional repressor LexA [Gammaproteobacteria bacterium]
MENLTPRQKDVLKLIRQHINNTGMPPTRSEIAKALGFKSANAAEQHLRALAKKGAIKMTAGTSRGIKIIGRSSKPKGLPVVGRVAAGSPLLAEQHIEEYISVEAELFHPPASYLLKVRGMSMKDIGILDDDLLAVHATKQAKNGDIVVARIEDEVTVKRFHQNEHLVTLIAENPDFAPIEVDLRHQNFEIEGLGVGIIRSGAL